MSSFRSRFTQHAEMAARPQAKKVPPPKPPRPLNFDEDGGEEEREELVRRVGADTTRPPLSHDGSNSGLFQDRPHPQDTEHALIPRSLREQSRSAECVAGEEEEECMGERQRVNSDPSSFSSSAAAEARRRVASLIQMFETKSPERQKAAAQTLPSHLQKKLPELPIIENDDIPIPPPRPRLATPPLPPRPFSTGCGERGVPEVPPRTPAPLLPPKPPGSMPPSTISHQRHLGHRRSLSDEQPPRLPPK